MGSGGEGKEGWKDGRKEGRREGGKEGEREDVEGWTVYYWGSIGWQLR